MVVIRPPVLRWLPHDPSLDCAQETTDYTDPTDIWGFGQNTLFQKVEPNYRPRIVGTDDAIWDRLRLVRFLIRIPEEERRPMGEMLAEFEAELPLRICSRRLALCSPCLCVFNSSLPGFRTRSLPWLRR